MNLQMSSFVLNKAGQAEILRASQKDQSFVSQLTQVSDTNKYWYIKNKFKWVVSNLYMADLFIRWIFLGSFWPRTVYYWTTSLAKLEGISWTNRKVCIPCSDYSVWFSNFGWRVYRNTFGQRQLPRPPFKMGSYDHGNTTMLRILYG